MPFNPVNGFLHSHTNLPLIRILNSKKPLISLRGLTTFKTLFWLLQAICL